MANERKIEVVVVGDSSSLERMFKRSASSAKGFNASLKTTSAGLSRFAKSAALAAGAAAGALAVLGVKGVRAASDLNEQINKSNVVFGQSAEAIRKWSETTASSLGLSQRAALEAAGGFGQMLETAGLTEDQAAAFSKNLVELAADMASFNNIDPTEALQKLKSGLAGEAEPLRQVGVLLSEARVKQEAYSSGLAKAGSVLTEQQKVQARYALILKDTAKQQGDFARTSDSLANSQRIVKASFENIAAQVGSAFLPAVAKATSGFADFLSDLGEAKGVKAKINVVLSTAADLGQQALDLAESARTQIGKALGQIDWNEAGRVVGEGLSRAMDAISRFLSSVDWGQLGTTIVRGITDFLKGVDWVTLLKATGTLIVKAIIALDTLLFNAAKELGSQILKGIRAGVIALAGLVVDGLKKLPGAWVAVAQFYLNQAKRLGAAVMDGIGRGLDDAKNFVLRKLLDFVNRILGVTGFLGRFDPFKGVREKVQSRLKEMEGDTKTSTGRIQTTINGLKGKDVAISVSERGVRDVQRAIDGIKGKDVVVRIRQTVEGALGGIGGLAVGAADSAATAGDNAIAQPIVAAAKKRAAAEKAAAEAAANARKAAAAAAKRAAAAAAKALEESKEAFATLMEALDLSAERAAATRSLQDDMKVAEDKEKAIRAQIRVEGRTNALLSQLFQVEQDQIAIQRQRTENRRAARQSNQFKMLGLTATGDTPTPSTGALKKRAASLQQLVKGTFLDTAKTRKQFAGIAKVLALGPKKVGKDVRAAILQMLNDISSALESGTGGKKGPLTKTTGLNTKKLVEGLGLTPDQIRQLRGRHAGFNSGGRALARMAQPAIAGGFISGASPVVVENYVTVAVDGQKFSGVVTKQQQKSKRRNPKQKRGPNRNR